MLSRNPELHYVFARLGLAEERGLGLRTLKLGAAGLPLPTYSFEDPYLTLTLYRNSEGLAAGLAPSIISSLNDEERAGWVFIASQPEITAADYAKQFGYEERKVQRHLKKFISLGMLRKVGAGRATKYALLAT